MLSRFPQVNLCTRKSPNQFIREYALGGAQSHETDLLPGSRINNLIRHRGDRDYMVPPGTKQKRDIVWCGNDSKVGAKR